MAVDARVLGIVIALILGLIGFFFISFCLAVIGDAEGERVVMRRNVVSIPGNNMPASNVDELTCYFSRVDGTLMHSCSAAP